MSKISHLTARTILDSRGEWTVEVTVASENGKSASASVPQGKSVGDGEAVSLPAERAVSTVLNDIVPVILGSDVLNQAEIDSTLSKLDGTKDKSRLGANAILGVSLAVAKLSAEEKSIPLWKRFRELLKTEGSHVSLRPSPRLFGNLINGGLHAEGGNLPFQEYLVIPEASSFRDASHILVSLFHTLHSLHPERFSLLGDEGGYGGKFNDPLEPFALFREASEKIGLSERIRFGLDAAGNNVSLPPQELAPLYRRMVSEYGLWYLEDPFPEGDIDSFAQIQKEFPDTFVCGDDLTATSVSRIRVAASSGAIRAAIIKPNQIGTVTETLDAVSECFARKVEPVVSHRSGETNDSSIADMAVAVSALGLKLGAPSRGERIAKYDRLMEIEESEYV